MGVHIGRALDWGADNVGNVLFVVFALVAAASIVLVIVLAISSAF